MDRPSLFRPTLIETAVLASSLLIMMELTQRLPVRFIPEQLLAAPVRDDMVYDGSCSNLTVGLADNAQRMLSQETPSYFLPAIGVTTFVAGVTVDVLLPIVIFLMLITVARAVIS